MHPNIHCSTIFNSQDMEATSMSMDRRMDKDVVYNGILGTEKSEKMPFAATWIALEIITLGKSKTNDTCYMWNLKKNDTIELNIQNINIQNTNIQNINRPNKT